ncbi:hypothetical protein PAPYR_12286 [Paratrimastix pyriformis]|uniref:Uncharacterized protein n=1 Tax=Paratrimastix pyriformis TaxID=342808 RepID=A0ABQ8U3R3_9EUKA|nr:hypothetical protein PAPYR_12286 [Paratrimastix pyriformis]
MILLLCNAGEAFDDLGRLCGGIMLNPLAPHSMYRLNNVVSSCDLLPLEEHEHRLPGETRPSDGIFFTFSVIRQLRNLLSIPAWARAVVWDPVHMYPRPYGSFQPDKLGSVFDGLYCRRHPLLSAPDRFVLGLHLLSDAGQAFKWGQGSILLGALVVANLPRELQHEESNLLLVLVAPKLKNDLIFHDSYYRRLKEELVVLLEGVEMWDASRQANILVQAVLLPSAFDYQEVAALLGAQGSGATRPCTHCEAKCGDPSWHSSGTEEGQRDMRLRNYRRQLDLAKEAVRTLRDGSPSDETITKTWSKALSVKPCSAELSFVLTRFPGLLAAFFFDLFLYDELHNDGLKLIKDLLEALVLDIARTRITAAVREELAERLNLQEDQITALIVANLAAKELHGFLHADFPDVRYFFSGMTSSLSAHHKLKIFQLWPVLLADPDLKRCYKPPAVLLAALQAASSYLLLSRQDAYDQASVAALGRAACLLQQNIWILSQHVNFKGTVKFTIKAHLLGHVQRLLEVGGPNRVCDTYVTERLVHWAMVICRNGQRRDVARAVATAFQRRHACKVRLQNLTMNPNDSDGPWNLPVLTHLVTPVTPADPEDDDVAAVIRCARDNGIEVNLDTPGAKFYLQRANAMQFRGRCVWADEIRISRGEDSPSARKAQRQSFFWFQSPPLLTRFLGRAMVFWRLVRVRGHEVSVVFECLRVARLALSPPDQQTFFVYRTARYLEHRADIPLRNVVALADVCLAWQNGGVAEPEADDDAPEEAEETEGARRVRRRRSLKGIVVLS